MGGLLRDKDERELLLIGMRRPWMMGIMRITGGEMCGRRVKVPSGRAVRPTQDRVRESLFASLGTALDGAHFLDLFAGSGVVGLEALSRGAERVTWVERDRRVLGVLRRNVSELGGNVRDIVPFDAMSFLRRGSGLQPFSLIFADPPYGTLAPSRDRKGRAQDIVSRFFGLIERREWLAPGGRVILEVDIREDLNVPLGWDHLAEKRYGQTKVLIAGYTGKAS